MSLLSGLARAFGIPPAFDAAPSSTSAALVPYDDLAADLTLEQLAAAALSVSPNVLGKPTWQPRDPAVYIRESYGRIALIYRCVNMIAHAGGVAPLRVYDDSGAGKGDEITDHPLRQLMIRPNPVMGESVFVSNIAMRAAVTGFCVVEKERDRAGNVIALWPMQSSWLRAIPRGDGTSDWEYRIPGWTSATILKAEDVIAFRWADTPDGSPYGMGPVEACLREAGILNAMTDFLKVTFERGAVPLLGMIPDLQPGQTLRQDQVDVITRRFVERHGGLDKASIPLVLAGIRDVKRIGLDFNELAYVDLRDLSELAIIHAFGIPASVAQVRTGITGSQGRANALADEGRFYRLTMEPFWSRLDDALTLNLLPEFDERPSISLKFDTSDVAAMQDDRDAKAAWVNAGVQIGWMTVHTAHRELGLALPPGDDYYLRPFTATAVPVTDPLDAAGTAALQPQPPAAPLQRLHEPDALQGTNPNIMSADLMAAYSTITNMLHRIERYDAVVGLGPKERRAKAATNGRKLIHAIAKARQPSLQRFFNGQADRVIPKVMEGLARGERIEQMQATATPEQRAECPFLAGAVGPRLSPETHAMESVNWQDEDARLAKVMNGLYQLAGDTAFSAAASQYGLNLPINFDLANPRVRDVMHRLATRVTQIGNQTRADIAEVVSQGLQDGLRHDEIAQNLSGLFEETYANRAATIARTESMVSYGFASTLAYKESGVVSQIQCFDNENHTDDYGAEDGLSCAERDGLIDTLDSADLHIQSEHPNGSLAIAPVIDGDGGDGGE